MLVVLGWIKLAGSGFLLAEGLARIGSGPFALFRGRRSGPAARWGMEFTLGWPSLGLMFLGLACAGLFYPFLIALCVLGALMVSRTGFSRRCVTLEALREAVRESRTGAIVALLVIVAVLPRVLLPETEHDAYLYHLGVPWQYLQVHRAVLSDVSWTFHYPLLVEMTFSLPLVLGDDRLAKVLAGLCFLAASAIFAARRRGNAGIGVLLALSCWYIFSLAFRAKNDIPASSLLIAGAACWMGRSFTLGSILLGLGAAAKPPYAFLVLFLLALKPPPRSRLFWAVGAVLAPWIPWMVKTWLSTGSPVFPFAASIFSPFGWTSENEAVLEAFLGRARESGIGVLPAEWARGMARDYLPVAALFPGLLFFSRFRRPACAVLAAGLVTILVAHNPRYLLPGVWLMALLAAESLGSVPSRVLRPVTLGLAGFALARMLFSLDPVSFAWRDALLPREKFLEKRLTTYEETVRFLEEAVPSRLLSVGERLTYRLPGRVLYGGQIGETPLIWKMAKDSGGIERLRVKFRQTGASHLLYNYISADWLARRYVPFKWDARMLDAYRAYLKKYHRVRWRTERNDFVQGGGYVFDILDRPRRPVAKRIWFAPGTEQVFSQVLRLENRGKHEALIEECHRVSRIMPDVGHSWNELAHAYSLLRKPAETYRYAKEFADEGMMDETNLPEYGVAAMETGRIRKAERLLTDSLDRYLSHRDLILSHLGRLKAIQAASALAAGDNLTALRMLEEGKFYLDSISMESSLPSAVEQKREVRAILLTVRGKLCLKTGRRDKAAGCFREANRIFPRNPYVSEWKDFVP